MNPEELLIATLKQNNKIVFGQSLGTNSDGNCLIQSDDGTIVARSPDEISAGSCTALKADDGQWYAVSSRPVGTVEKKEIFKRKNKVVTEEGNQANVIFLFKDDFKFYVGGDREAAELIYSMPETMGGKNLLFVKGTIQKTALAQNNFVVNFILKQDPPPSRTEDITEPITYLLYSIKAESDDGDFGLTALDDSLLILNQYNDGTLSAYKQVLVLPQYPERAIPKLLQDNKATLNDKGYYQGFELSRSVQQEPSFCFQYGYFRSFEIAEGTISETKSGEWHNLDPEGIPPNPPTIGGAEDLDFLPQFEPDDLQYHERPYQAPYDYTPIKFTYDPEDAPPKKYACSDGECIEYIDGTFNSLEECNSARQFQTEANGLITYNDGSGRTLTWVQALGIPLTANSFGEPATLLPVIEEPTTGSFLFVVNITARQVDGSYMTTPFLIAGLGLGTASPTHTITSQETEVVACPLLPPIPPNTNTGCIDKDSRDYDELDNPDLPDLRTTETCGYNPYRMRSNRRVLSVDLVVDPDTGVLPEPTMELAEQNIVQNNPIPKPDGNESSTDIKTEIYDIEREFINAEQKVTVTYFAPTIEDPREFLGVSSDYKQSILKVVSSDAQSHITTLATKYQAEINDEFNERKETEPDLSLQDVVDKYTLVKGFFQDYPLEDFKAPSSLFDVETSNNNRSVLEMYSANWVRSFNEANPEQVEAEALFIVGSIEDSTTLDLNPVEVVRLTRNSEEEIEMELLTSNFIGDSLGDIVDASAFFEEIA